MMSNLNRLHQNQLKIIKYLFFSFLILIQINSGGSSCPNGVYLSNTDCFDNLITIKKNYRGGQFATNLNGDMFIEYSNDNGNSLYKRFFVGLKKNGRGFFPMKISTKKRMSNTPIQVLDMADMNQGTYLYV